VAQAYALTRGGQVSRVLQEQLESWIGACPYGRGPNWWQRARGGDQTDQLVIAWQLAGGAAAPFFAGSDGARFKRRWLDSVYEHARFVHGYFSRHSSANNHLIGEAAGLYIAGLTWPCVQAARVAPRGAPDPRARGAAAEFRGWGQSRAALCYQQFVLDFLLLALLAGRSAGERFSAAYEQRVAAMLEFWRRSWMRAQYTDDRRLR